MSSVVIAGNTSGSVTLAAPDVAGTTTLTLPATSGTVMVNGPAFSAYRNGLQTGIVTNVWTKVQINAEQFDTANAFDSTTNYRFQPTVAGYYQFTGCLVATGANITYLIASVYKNGSLAARGTYSITAANEAASNMTSLIYLNGSTDYAELYVFCNVTSGTLTLYGADAFQTVFTGAIVRSA